MDSLDDTQPHPPFEEQPPEDEILESDGPGCMAIGLVAVFLVGFALLIVALAGTAGWTAGQRTADQYATATQSSLIQEQLIRLPTDAADGNQHLVRVRLEYLATLTPGVPAVPQFRETATALYLASQPTPPPSPTETPISTATEPAAEITEAVVTPQSEDSTYDLAGLLEEARQQQAVGQLEEAQETLDAIIRIDPNFQRSTVREMMGEVLTNQARNLYVTADPANLAEAIRLTTLAESYGADIGDLDYERLLAGLYLDVQRTTDHLAAINGLRRIINQYQDTYKGIDLRRMLFDEYRAYAQAFEFGGEYCQAVVQYNNALNLFSSAEVTARRDAAQTICEEGTPTPGAGATPTAAPGG